MSSLEVVPAIVALYCTARSNTVFAPAITSNLPSFSASKTFVGCSWLSNSCVRWLLLKKVQSVFFVFSGCFSLNRTRILQELKIFAVFQFEFAALQTLNTMVFFLQLRHVWPSQAEIVVQIVVVVEQTQKGEIGTAKRGKAALVHEHPLGRREELAHSRYRVPHCCSICKRQRLPHQTASFLRRAECAARHHKCTRAQ